VVSHDGFSSFVPVKLISFDATAKSDYNLISWTAGSEVNIQWQIIESSVDGKEWTELDKLASKGGSSDTHYETVDRYPTQVTFYRLKSVDFDGYTEIFEPVVVRRGARDNKLSIASMSPNPANDFVTISINSEFEEEIELQLIDMTGKIILHKAWLNDDYTSSINLDLTEIATGAYFLNVKSKNYTTTKRLIISK